MCSDTTSAGLVGPLAARLSTVVAVLAAVPLGSCLVWIAATRPRAPKRQMTGTVDAAPVTAIHCRKKKTVLVRHVVHNDRLVDTSAATRLPQSSPCIPPHVLQSATQLRHRPARATLPRQPAGRHSARLPHMASTTTNCRLPTPATTRRSEMPRILKSLQDPGRFS
jgi:hypothetical protein